jgi:hypothetical protein
VGEANEEDPVCAIWKLLFFSFILSKFDNKIKLTIYVVPHGMIFVISKMLYILQEIYLLVMELSGKFENCHLLNVKKGMICRDITDKETAMAGNNNHKTVRKSLIHE